MNYHIEFDLELVKNTYSGQYFALEGIDGSGKTTQVEKLAAYFQKQNKEVLITKEPTEGIVGELIHTVINGQVHIPSISLQYLFAADRAIHLQDVVIPALQKGSVVISDRSLWSAVAYGIADLPAGRQASMHESEKERLLLAHNVLALYGGFLIPDKTFVIGVSADVAMQRVEERKKEQTLYEKTTMLAKVEKEYIWLAEKFKDALVLVDGTKSKDEVFEQIKGSM